MGNCDSADEEMRIVTKKGAVSAGGMGNCDSANEEMRTVTK